MNWERKPRKRFVSLLDRWGYASVPVPDIFLASSFLNGSVLFPTYLLALRGQCFGRNMFRCADEAGLNSSRTYWTTSLGLATLAFGLSCEWKYRNTPFLRGLRPSRCLSCVNDPVLKCSRIYCVERLNLSEPAIFPFSQFLPCRYFWKWHLFNESLGPGARSL